MAQRIANISNGVNAARRSSTARRRAGAQRRPGYVLVVVLGLSVVAFSTGVAFIESQGTVLPEAVNRMAAVRARYMAESGVELAIHYLMYPPNSVATGDYWQGAVQQRVDSTEDFFTVIVQKDESVEGQYTIRCKGVALYYDGEVRGAHSIRATVLVPPSGTITVDQALLAGDRIALDTSVFIVGDVHVNEFLWSFGYVSGHVSATQSVIWSNPSPPASITENAPTVVLPTLDPTNYLAYWVKGSEYQALVYPDKTITPANAAIINSALDAQTNNPGRVVYCTETGKLEVEPGVSINGTLAGEFNLEFIDAGNRAVVPEDGFPAVATTGHIHAEDDGTVVNLGGMVFGEMIEFHNKDNVRMGINGPLIITDSDGLKNMSGASAVLSVGWSEAKATIYDPAAGDRRPITILSWEENY